MTFKGTHGAGPKRDRAIVGITAALTVYAFLID